MKKITITWIDHDAAYKVSESAWDGGDVYLASEVDARIDELESLLRRSWLKPAHEEPDLCAEVMKALGL